jgi:hypothetical protein
MSKTFLQKKIRGGGAFFPPLKHFIAFSLQEELRSQGQGHHGSAFRHKAPDLKNLTQNK